MDSHDLQRMRWGLSASLVAVLLAWAASGCNVVGSVTATHRAFTPATINSQSSAVAISAPTHPLRIRALYRLTDLGIMGDPDETAIALNNKGEVVLSDIMQGFIWRHGHWTALPPVPGMPQVVISGINDQGQVVGGVSATDSGAMTVTVGDATMWNQGKAISLGGLPNLSDSVATAINNRGQIIGRSDPGSILEHPDAPHAFLWDKGQITDLGTGWATAINSTGTIVGNACLTEADGDRYSDCTEAILWNQGRCQKLGTLPGWTCSAATDLNDVGDVVGTDTNDTDNASEAFLWTAGRLHDLGPGQANGINQLGQIVGSLRGRAVLWWRGGMCDLTDCLLHRVDWTLTQAKSINDSGQIVGFGTDRGHPHAFLLTPLRAPRCPSISHARP